MSRLLTPRKGRRDGVGARALLIALGYAVLSATWILVSDRLVVRLFHDPDTIVLVQTLKGWLFVALTSILLFLLTRKMALPESFELGGAKPVGQVLAVVVVVSMAAAGVAVWFTFVGARGEAVARLESVADRKAKRVGDWLRDRLDDAELLARVVVPEDPNRHAAGSVIPAGGGSLPTQLEKWVRHGEVQAISLLDLRGERLWRTSAAPADLSVPLLEAARRAAAARRPGWVGPYMETGRQVRFDMVVPLVRAGTVSGLVVLHIDPTTGLFPAVAARPEDSASGEALLIRRDGERIRYLSALRFRPDNAQFELPLASQAQIGGLDFGGSAAAVAADPDYRGVSVFQVQRPVPGTDWLLAVKVDRAELYAKAVSEMLWIALVGLLTMFAAGLGVHALSQRRHQRIATQTAAVIAHDLNQPLAAVSAYSDAASRMLREGVKNPEKLAYAIEASASQAMRAGKSLHELMQFLHHGEVDADALTLLDLNEVVRQAVAQMQEANPGTFRPILDLQDGLPPVHGSHRQVRKVLANLLQNGVDAMRAGGVVSEAAAIRVKTQVDAKSARVTVQDSGPGVASHAVARVFEAFFTTKVRGMGIGLAVCRALIESNGGRLWLDRRVGVGTGAVFHFTLPIAA